MLGDSTFALTVSKEQILTGLQVMMLDDGEVSGLWADERIGLTEPSHQNEKTGTNLVAGTIPPIMSNGLSKEKMSDLLLTICLEYPFWSDFRILDFFNKRGISINMEELQNLRSECGIASKEDVCRELVRIYVNDEITLTKNQVQFIERLNPVFRDRDFRANGPGDLLVYECIFFRRLNKMFYLHLVFDLFNGHAFGRVSRRCSGEIGLRLLQEKIVPFYRSRGYRVNQIVHSIKSTREHWEQEESNIRESVLEMGIDWLEPKHEFGIIQRFQRDFLDGFFQSAEAFHVSLVMIQPAFDRWVIKYNGISPFHQRRNFLGYEESVEELDRAEATSICN